MSKTRTEQEVEELGLMLKRVTIAFEDFHLEDDSREYLKMIDDNTQELTEEDWDKMLRIFKIVESKREKGVFSDDSK